MRLPIPNDPATEDLWGQQVNDLLTELVGPATLEPGSPNAKDDEFDGTSSVTWTTTPTAPTVMDTTTRPGTLRINGNATGATYVGKVQPVPGAYPYTITTKVLASTVRGGNCRGGGIILTGGTASGSDLVYFGLLLNSTVSAWAVKGTLGGTWQGGLTGKWDYMPRTNVHFKVVVTSATVMDFYVSFDGFSWFKCDTASTNPGFTPTHMGLAVADESNGQGGIEALFDFFRVT